MYKEDKIDRLKILIDDIIVIKECKLNSNKNDIRNNYRYYNYLYCYLYALINKKYEEGCTKDVSCMNCKTLMNPVLTNRLK